MKNPEFAEPLGTPLPYSRHEPWTLAPWLTGIIVALVIFVILIPALCSACYHYYSYKLGLDEEIDQEEYLEDDYDEEDYYDDESSSESCEDDEKGQTTTTRPMALKDRGDEQCDRHGSSDGSNILRPINSGKGSIITCCPRLFLPTGSVMPSCQLDADLPRLPCGHMGVPTRDIAIQVPRAIPAQENIYDEEGPSSTPSTTADDPHSEMSHICNNHSRADSRTVTWKSFLSPPSTEESSSSAPYNNERPAQEELLIGGLRSAKCNRCGGYELSRHQGTHSRTPDSTMLQNNHHLHCCGNSANGNGKPSPLTLDSHQLFLHSTTAFPFFGKTQPPSNHEVQEEYLLDQNWCSLAQKLQAKFSLSSKSLVYPGSPDKKILSNYHGPPHQLRRPKTLLSNGFIIPRPPLPNGIIMNRSTPNLLSESHNNQEAILSPVTPSAIDEKTSADLNHQAVTMVEDSSELETSV